MLAARSNVITVITAVLVLALIAGVTVAMTVRASTATGGSVTLYLSDNTGTDSGCLPAPASVSGSMENSNPVSSQLSSPAQTTEFCTSSSGAFAGPALSVTSISVTLYAASFSGNIAIINNSVLSQPGGSTLGLIGSSSSLIWSTTSCAPVTFSIPVSQGAQLSAGNVALTLAFAELGTPSTGEPMQICTGGSTPSSVTINGTTGSSTSSSSSSSSTSPPPQLTGSCQVAHLHYYIQFFGISGPVATTDFRGWFNANSFSWGDSAAGSTGPVTPPSGATPFNVTMVSTTQSRLLLLGAASGQVFPSITFDVFSPTGGGGVNGCNFMKFEMDNAVITSYHVSGVGNNLPEDSLMISFQKLVMTQCVVNNFSGATTCANTNVG